MIILLGETAEAREIAAGLENRGLTFNARKSGRKRMALRPRLLFLMLAILPVVVSLLR